MTNRSSFKDKIYCLTEAAKFVDTHTIQCPKCKIFSMVDKQKSYINCSACGKNLSIKEVYSSQNPTPIFEQIEPDSNDMKSNDEYFVEGILNHCVSVDEKGEKWFFQIKWYDFNEITWEPLKNVFHLDLFDKYMEKCESRMTLRGYISIN